MPGKLGRNGLVRGAVFMQSFEGKPMLAANQRRPRQFCMSADVGLDLRGLQRVSIALSAVVAPCQAGAPLALIAIRTPIKPPGEFGVMRMPRPPKPRSAPEGGSALRIGSQPNKPGLAAPLEGNDAPLPHERDQAAGQVSSAPDPIIEQASRDLDAGMVDTDMRATPGLDAARRARLVPTPAPDATADAPAPAPAPAPARGTSPTPRRRAL